MLPMIAPTTAPVLWLDDVALSACEDAVEDEPFDVAVGWKPVEVVLATTATPSANPSYGNAKAWSDEPVAVKIEDALILAVSYEVTRSGTLKMFVKHVPPKAGRSDGASEAGANPSHPLGDCQQRVRQC